MAHKFNSTRQLEIILRDLDGAELRTVHKGPKIDTKTETGQTFINQQISNKSEENHMAIVNERTEKVASIVSDRYMLLEHEEAFEEILFALKDLGIGISGDVKEYNDGNVAVIEATFDSQEFTIGESDECLMGFKAINSYDTSAGFQIHPYGLRLVCQNGMMAEGLIDSLPSLKRVHKGHDDITSKIALWLKDLSEHSQELGDFLEEKRREYLRNPVIVLRKAGFSETMAEEILEYVQRDKISEDHGYTEAENVASRFAIYDGATYYLTHEVEGMAYSTERTYNKAANRILTKKKEVLNDE